jgi:predicted nucleic acid-binding protein
LKSISPPMPDRIVLNTGPLIALIRAEAIEVLARLPYRFVCPPQVELEIRAGASLGHPFLWPDCLAVGVLNGALDPLAQATLDVGEAAVIQLALEQGIEWVCIDERKGRRVALAVGLKVVGSLGLLARAKNVGIIPAVRPIIERLTREGIWYDGELVERVLTAIGE